MKSNDEQRKQDGQSDSVSRRGFLATLSGAVAGGAWSPRAGRAGPVPEADKPVAKGGLPSIEQVIGLDFTDAERELLLGDLERQLEVTDELHRFVLDNHVAPALQFHPERPGMTWPTEQRAIRPSTPQPRDLPSPPDELAWWSVVDLAGLIRTRKISAVELMQFYLQRLKEQNEHLYCVISFTEERALDQARRADREIASGRYLGPLHGIPWGAKDLFAVPGYKTTWGAMPYKDQRLAQTATVVERLDQQDATGFHLKHPS